VTDEIMMLRALLEKSSDADLLRLPIHLFPARDHRHAAHEGPSC
jgi:hypothetical protein